VLLPRRCGERPADAKLGAITPEVIAPTKRSSYGIHTCQAVNC
jgi:hypothetical protein